jgi:hypothetical protein
MARNNPIKSKLPPRNTRDGTHPAPEAERAVARSGIVGKRQWRAEAGAPWGRENRHAYGPVPVIGSEANFSPTPSDRATALGEGYTNRINPFGIL